MLKTDINTKIGLTDEIIDNTIEFEEFPHITVVYGIYDEEIEKVKHFLIRNVGSIDFYIGDFAVFEKDDHDILHIEIMSKHLMKLEKDIRKMFLCKPSDFYEYKPHITIGKIKKGGITSIKKGKRLHNSNTFTITTGKRGETFQTSVSGKHENVNIETTIKMSRKMLESYDWKKVGINNLNWHKNFINSIEKRVKNGEKRISMRERSIFLNIKNGLI